MAPAPPAVGAKQLMWVQQRFLCENWLHLVSCGTQQQNGVGTKYIKPYKIVFPPPFPSWGHFPAISKQRDIPELENNPLKTRNLVHAQP